MLIKRCQFNNTDSVIAVKSALVVMHSHLGSQFIHKYCNTAPQYIFQAVYSRDIARSDAIEIVILS